MDKAKTNILIIGAGKGGSALVELFHDDASINIVGIVDPRLDAPGIKLAVKFSIPTSTDYKDFINIEGLDEVIDVTGSEVIQEGLLKDKPGSVEVVGGHSAKLLWDLVGKQKASMREMKRANDIQFTMNLLLRLSLKDLSLEELLDIALQTIISIPWLALESKGAIFLADEYGDKLEMKAQNGLGPELLTMCSSVPFGRCLCGRAAAEKKVIFKDHIDTEHENFYDGIKPHGHYCVPIISFEAQVIGVITLYVRAGYIREEREDEFLSMVANTLAGIIERARAKKDLQVAYDKLKNAQLQLIQAEKMGAVGVLASGVAHEVKNPLSIIMQGIDYLENVLISGEKGTHETLKIIKESVKRADSVIMSLLDFSRDSTLSLEARDLTEILEESLNLVKQKLRSGKIDIEIHVDAGMPKVIVDRYKIEQVFVNIMLNAVQAMPGGGRLILRGYTKMAEGKKTVIVEIEDSGAGIAPENLRKVFDPFFTTKGPREGVGLGLAVTKNIIDLHNGLIEIKSELGKGTTVVLTLRAEG